MERDPGWEPTHGSWRCGAYSGKVQRELTPSPPPSTERKSVTGGDRAPARDELEAGLTT
jgi:hypothetical protein